MKRKQMKLFSFISYLSIISLLIFSSFTLLTQLAVYQRDYQKRSEKLRNDYLSNQKKIIKEEVDRIIYRIDYQESKIVKEAEETLKNRINNAYALISAIYAKEKNNHDKDAILLIIKDALRDMTHDEGKNYYFINDMNGYTILNGAVPELENKNNLKLKDKINGHYIIKDMIELMNTQDLAYYQYNWPKPGSPRIYLEKNSLLKRFSPLNIYIGTGIYTEDIREKMQRSLIESLEYVYADRPDYIFAGTWEGISLEGPSKGQNVLHIEDKNGLKVVQELIRVSQLGRGYVEYVMPDVSGNANRNKISYVRGIDQWGWYLGAGVYLDEINTRIDELRREIIIEIKRGILTIITLTMTIMFFLLIILNLLNRYLSNDFALFIHFFEEASLKDRPIEMDRIKFSELYSLADYANQMITTKAMIQNDLKKEKEQLTITLQSIDNGVISLDKEKHIIHMNHRAEELTRFELSRARGLALHKVYKKTDNPRMTIINRANDIIYIEESLKSTYDSQGEISGYVLVFRDIGQRLKLEEEKQKTRNLESIGHLAGGIAHNFNNILTGLFGNMELALSEIKEGNLAKEYLETSLESMEQAKNLTAQLLTFAKGGKPNLQKMDMALLLEEISQKGAHCHITKEDNFHYVWGDNRQLTLLFDNLIQNAWEAMENDKEITINIHNVYLENYSKDNLTGPFVRIVFADKGRGIAEENLSRIFDPYFSTKNIGHGLGLTTAFSIVKNHNGLIEVQSELKKGSTFIIYLPGIIN